MPLEDDDAVVLQRLDYSESSQVLVFFTHRHGKVRAIAKGVKRSTKKRFAVGIELLELGHLVFSTRTARQSALAILTEWKPGRPLGGQRRAVEDLVDGARDPLRIQNVRVLEFVRVVRIVEVQDASQIVQKTDQRRLRIRLIDTMLTANRFVL